MEVEVEVEQEGWSSDCSTTSWTNVSVLCLCNNLQANRNGDWPLFFWYNKQITLSLVKYRKNKYRESLETVECFVYNNYNTKVIDHNY